MLADFTRRFSAGPGYLNTATVGLPAPEGTEALRRSLIDWESGRCEPAAFDAFVNRSRAAYAAIVGAQTGSVAIVGQVSVAGALVASSLPDGSRVLCAEEDFTSMLYPFLTDRRLTVDVAPLSQIIERITPAIDLVAVSAVQSSDGRVIDLDDVVVAAAASNTRTYIDVTQAAGWLSIDASRFDVTACAAYKWLCCPRGVGFVTVGSHADWLEPLYPGWYAGDDPWQSLYGPEMQLAPDARRFDVSPAWFDFVAAAPTLELIAATGMARLGEHSVGIANHFRQLMGLPVSNSAIVSVATEAAHRLAPAGVTAATRAGRARLSFYGYNTPADAELAATALTH
jgi:selenocysteine lyase/cysteine desulfurase